MNADEQFGIYIAFKKNPHIFLNDPLDFKSYQLYDTVIGNNKHAVTKF